MEDLLACAEYPLGEHEFETIRELIWRRAGIRLAPSKRSMVYNRLVRRLREKRSPGFAEYLAELADERSPEWQPFVNALTTNLTAFFREEYHFPALAAFLRARAAANRRLRIWCAASSTGEEPYSIAMTVIDALGARPPVDLLATDIDTRVLAVAERGVYDLDAVTRLDPALRQRYFLRGTGRNAGQARVRDELRRLVRFGQLNLVGQPWPHREPFDAIFCRNVLIYFDRDTKTRIIEAFHRIMHPDALLFVGHSENFSDRRDLFALEGRTIYRRLAGPAA